MTYEEALKAVNGRLRFGIKPGLERITALLGGLGDPHKGMSYVHVAGTNGKGTVSTLTASALKESGLRTGLYTSPYVLEFRERFQIDGEMISEEELAAQVEKLLPVCDELEAKGDAVTEFEFITALAFNWFSERRCDIVVLEVGLGGRFDATNVIDVPDAAAIMSISLDHTAVLGDTLEQIAFEKAGIIKPGGKVALYPFQEDCVKKKIAEVCKERGAELIIPDESFEILSSSVRGTEFRYSDKVLFTPFQGGHQVKNAITAYTVTQILDDKGFPLTDESVLNGFKKAFLPARMEIITEKPLCILDGGHNPGCAAALKDTLDRFVPGKKVAVMGMAADKDVRETLRILGPLFSAVITVAPDTPRAMPAKELAELAGEFCPLTHPTETCGEALAAAMKYMDEDTSLIVCGSFFLASEIRQPLMGKMKNLERG